MNFKKGVYMLISLTCIIAMSVSIRQIIKQYTFSSEAPIGFILLFLFSLTILYLCFLYYSKWNASWIFIVQTVAILIYCAIFACVRYLESIKKESSGIYLFELIIYTVLITPVIQPHIITAYIKSKSKK